MSPDGTLRATIAIDEVANLYNITFQALPKVQGTFRYTIFNPKQIAGSGDGLRDRSYEIKAEVVEERYLIPQIAIGARDVLGTGAWEEYLVASKQWNSFDFPLASVGTVGNSFRVLQPAWLVSDKFESRPEALAVHLAESLAAQLFPWRRIYLRRACLSFLASAANLSHRI